MTGHDTETDIRTLLHSVAASPARPLDMQDVYARAARLRRRRVLAWFAGLAAVLGAAIPVGTGVVLQPGAGDRVAVVHPEPDAATNDHVDAEVGLTTSDTPDPARPSAQRDGSSQRVGGLLTTPSSSAPGSQGSGGAPASTNDGEPSPSAGPPVSYTDQADDAWGYNWATRSTAVSQKAFDILRVDWAPAPGGYSTSITVAGTATDGGAYVSAGNFQSSDAGQCSLRHYLRPGSTAFTEVSCPSGLSDRMQGGPVTSTPTADGGTVLSATFDNGAIPPSLQAAGRRLHDLSAATCVAKGSYDCNWADMVDTATSTSTYLV
jgi:hypothetical protein